MAFTEPFPEYEFLHDDLDPAGHWVVTYPPPGPGAGAADDEADALGADTAPRSTAARLRHRGATAAMFTALALAYKEVFEPKRPAEVVIEVDAGQPFDPMPLEFQLAPGDPQSGRVILRRWLRG